MQGLENSRNFVLIYLNGKRTEVRGSDVFLNLSDYLRLNRQLTGTKVVCAEGDCGACTVLRAFPKGDTDEVTLESINSCIIRVAQMDGSSLVTVEGLGAPYENRIHPVQRAMIQCHGSQCGFCTPGFVGSMVAYFETHTQADTQKIKNALTGNLCRCTGYQPILDAALSVDPKDIRKLSTVYATSEICKDLRMAQTTSVWIAEGDRAFFAPATESDILWGFQKYPRSTILAGGTDLGVGYNKGRLDPKVFLSLHLMSALYEMTTSSEGRVRVGARVTLSELRKEIRKQAPEVASFLDIFASPQIKNFATLVGNIANASPIADTPPLLFALNGQLEIFSAQKSTRRKIPFEKFNLEYKKTQLQEGEIIWAIEFDLPRPGEKVAFSKTSQRRDLDISCVNSGFWFKPGAENPLIPAGLRLGVGGVGPIPMRLEETEKYLINTGVYPETIRQALSLAQQEVAPLSDLRGSAKYRRVLLAKFLERFLNQIYVELREPDIETGPEPVPAIGELNLPAQPSVNSTGGDSL